MLTTRPPSTDPGRYFDVDVAKALGISYETVRKYRGISLAEGGAGPRGLPDPDGHAEGLGPPRPWWRPETIVWWAVTVGLLHPYTGEPQRMAQSNTPHPRRPTVRVTTKTYRGRPRGPVVDPDYLRQLMGDTTRTYLDGVAELSGYPVATVKRKFRHISLAEGGAGPQGMPLPDGYDPPPKPGPNSRLPPSWWANLRPVPWWLASTINGWLVATGRKVTYRYAGKPQRARST